MLGFYKDTGLILEYNNEEYVRFVNSVKNSSIQSNQRLDEEFLNLHLHPSTRNLAGFASLVYDKKQGQNTGNQSTIHMTT